MAHRFYFSSRIFRQPLAVAAAVTAGWFSTGDLLAQQLTPLTDTQDPVNRLLVEKEHRFADVPLLNSTEFPGRPGSYEPTRVRNTEPVPSNTMAPGGQVDAIQRTAARDLLGEFLDVNQQAKNRARVVVDAPASSAPSRNWTPPRLNPVSGAVPNSGFEAMQTSFQMPQEPQSNGFNQGSVAHLARANSDRPAQPTRLTGVHQLTNISMDQFERTVIDVWGTRLQTAVSADGRYVRVRMPSRMDQPMSMLIDRQTGKLVYEGEQTLLDNWHQLVATIDTLPSRLNNGSVQHTALVDRNHASMQTIEQVVYWMGYGVQQPQDDQPQAQLPPGTQLPGQEDDLVQGIQGLKKPVRIVEDPETGVITLIGEPEDVAIVRRELLRLSKAAQSKQPVVTRIPLVNVQSGSIEERAQEIYDQSFAPVNGPAQITAIDSPNMLVVVGQPKAIEAIQQLVKEIDVESDAIPTDDFRAFKLKFLGAADAKNRLDNYFAQSGVGQGDNTLPSAAVAVIADFRSNQVLVKGAQQYLRQAEVFLAAIDVDKGEAVNEVKIFRLRNALAEEIALVIQDAVSGQQPNANQAFVPSGGQNAGGQQQGGNTGNVNASDSQSQLRSAMLSLRTMDAQGQMIDGGIMFDVRVTADRNSNSLIVTAPGAAMPLVEELVLQLDRIPDAETQIKVFELVYGDAETLLGMLQTLFGSANQQTQGQGTNLSQLPLQGASQSDGATLINLRFSIEPRSNAIIASGAAGDLQVVEDLLNRLDARAINSAKPKVYRLSNAPAQDVADAINSYLDARNTIIENDPRTNTGVTTVQRSVIVTPEVVSNSLIVEALPEYSREIEEIIFSLDRRPPMVKVKILIAEVDLSTLEEFGVEIGVQDSLLFDRGTSIGAAGEILDGIGFPFNNQQTANLNAVGREDLPAQALSYLGVGKINTGLGYGGLVLSAGNESVNLLMRALKDRQCVRTLSKPHIMTVENLQGRVAIGSSVARIAGTTQSNFGVTQDIEFQDVGVILEVTPRVSPDGMIILTVNAEKSAVGPESSGTTIGIGSNGEPIKAQQILKTEATTTLMARTGQTVVFSGLIEETKSHFERGTPILSDLPVIGPLFKYESDSVARTELMIIMTPYLVTDDQDLTMLNQDEFDRMHWCLCDVAEVYGGNDFGDVQGNEGAVQTVYPDSNPAGDQPPAVLDSRLDLPSRPILSANPEVDGQSSNQATNGNVNEFIQTAAERNRRGILGNRRR